VELRFQVPDLMSNRDEDNAVHTPQFLLTMAETPHPSGAVLAVRKGTGSESFPGLGKPEVAPGPRNENQDRRVTRRTVRTPFLPEEDS
jgi:hypothetical protein